MPDTKTTRQRSTDVWFKVTFVKDWAKDYTYERKVGDVDWTHMAPWPDSIEIFTGNGAESARVPLTHVKVEEYGRTVVATTTETLTRKD